DECISACLGNVGISSEAECNAAAGNSTDLVWMERKWKNSEMHFDNMAAAMITLFEMSTTEGWTEVMTNGIDGVSSTQSFQRDYQLVRSLYFLAFMVICSMFILNLTVGIIMDNFHLLKMEETATGVGITSVAAALLSKRQREWVQAYKAALKYQGTNKEPKGPPCDWKRTATRNFFGSVYGEVIVMGAILLSTLVMTLEHYDQSDTWTAFLETSSIVFMVVFTLECVVKIWAYSPVVYFSVKWNKFDFFTLCASYAGLVFSYSAGSGSVFRVLRCFRVVRMVKKLKSVQKLVDTFVMSLPSILNISALIFLLFYVYAILGVNLFGKVVMNGALNRHSNFRTFGQAMITLLRMATGEAWNAIMHACSVQPPDCSNEARPPPACHPGRPAPGLQQRGAPPTCLPP
ncbi:hypothetical protein CYMTET_32981, partial [Cymbomonas tetramitiformis]